MQKINFKIAIVFFLIFTFSCKKEFKHTKIKSNKINDSLFKKSKLDYQNWHLKDIEIDTVPGISINRAYDSLLLNKKGEDVIVAVIDMGIDINHLALKKHIWLNQKEVQNNNIDDDDNGYIDDINGWNFLGNSKRNFNEFVNYEYTRILKEFNPIFQNKESFEINSKDSLNFIIYQRAKNKYKERNKYAKEDLDYIDMIINGKKDAEKEISKYLINKKFTISNLDSLKAANPKNELLLKMIKRKSNFIRFGYTDEYINDYKLKASERIAKLLNLNFDDRKIQSDDPNDILDISYGSNIVNNNVSLLDHGTYMAGSIVAISKMNEIKIMPLVISAYGDEHDKDIALAIKYAVDHGAKVINMSFAKEFSLKPKWILDAIDYANKSNVLLVNGASNEGENMNQENISWFPNDRSYFDTIEVSDNFLKVASSGVKLNDEFRSTFSNYGNIDVDLFAPGENIYTTAPNNKYTSSRGTSHSSAITSGVAGLIYSYYPNLTASQVKHILMDSGLEYTFEVSTPTKEDKNKTTPFNQLSKSGRVLNAYNALIMADSISRR